MKKIIFICPYFGKYPNYFNLTLNSIKYNDTIDWLIITDIKKIYEYPQNVKIINMTFDELREKVQSVFDFKISLDTPYKICDYKCAYGYIFKEYISSYDFWGHCDFDCIYGDLRKYLTENILNKYEKVYEDCDNCFEQFGTYLGDFKRQCDKLLDVPSAGISKGSREI